MDKGGLIMPDKDLLKLFKESLKNKNTYIPNLLTASRLVGAFVIPTLFLTGNIPGALIATAAFSATDFFDGLAARKLDGYSEFGRLLDPIVDKVFAAVPALAIVPSMPILALNVAMEAVIGLINAKSFSEQGNPQSSRLGKIKTWCLFPTIGLAYLATALGTPELTALTAIASLGTLGVQTAVAKDYYETAKKEQATTTSQFTTQEEEENKQKENELENNLTAEKTIQIEKKTPPRALTPEEKEFLNNIDLSKIPGLMLAEPEISKPKTLRKQPNETNKSDN